MRVSYLVEVDMDVETAPLVIADGVGEFLVGFAESPGLFVDELDRVVVFDCFPVVS